MSKKILVLLLSLSLLLSLVACGQGKAPETTGTGETTKATEASDPTTEPVQEDTTAATETTAPAETGNQAAEDLYLEKYAPVLDRYSQALQEQWNEGVLFQEGMCTFSTYCYEGNPLENVGYTLMDLSGDHVPELLVGATGGDAYVQDVLFEVYTLQNDVPVQLLVSNERSSYRLCDDDGGCYFLVNQASVSAAQREWLFFIITDDQLAVMQGVVYDAAADTENPWFMTYDDDWDTSNDTAIDEATAKAIMDGYEARCFVPEYTLFAAR